MSYIFFQAGEVQFVMDSYTSCSAPLTAQLSGSPMQSGEEQADNYVVGLPEVTLSGIITDVKTARSRDAKPTAEWITRIYQIMNDKQPVLLQPRVSEEPTDGWFITSFNPQQNLSHGVGARKDDGTFIESFEVTIQFKRPILARGLVSTVQPPQAYLDPLQTKGSKSATTGQFDETTDKGKRDSERSFEIANKWLESAGKQTQGLLNFSQNGDN